MSRIIIAHPDGTDQLEVDQGAFNNGFFPGYVYVRAASGSPSNPLAPLDDDMTQVANDSSTKFYAQQRAAFGVLRGTADPGPSLPTGTEYVWMKTDGAGHLLDILSGVA